MGVAKFMILEEQDFRVVKQGLSLYVKVKVHRLLFFTLTA